MAPRTRHLARLNLSSKAAIPLRLLLAAQPKLVTPVLQVVRRVITRHLLGPAGLKPDEADSGAVTLINALARRPTSTFTCAA